MITIKFLGGVREVGRSAILIEANNGNKCILDYGIRFRGEERTPLEADLSNLKAITLTHAHVDHSGAIPAIYRNKSVPLLTNSLTLDIIQTLIKDTIRISNFPYPFGYRELDKLVQHSHFLEKKTRKKIADDFFITYYDAGHIPGSVSILVEVDGKRILYTGDINNQPMNLINSANASEIPEIDVLITESTYALREHPPREEVEKRFVENVIEITDNGGKVLIPAFGVARSQEALMILQKYNYSGKIFVDGMARKICDDYLQNPEYLKDPALYKSAINKAQFIRKKGREEAKRSAGAIISPSGMLKGGASIGFVKSFLNDPTSAIYLVGYQVEGSPGRKLLEEGVFEYKEKRRNRTTHGFKMVAKCDREYFDFSSHADGPHLHKYIENLKFRGEPVIFCVHGDNKSCTTFASELVKKGYQSVAPEIGEVYKV